MVVEWLVPLLGAGGSALVAAAATDAWTTVRAGVVRFFGHAGDRRRELAERWVDETAAELASTPLDLQADAQARWAEVWRQRFADLLEEHPEIADEFRDWVAEVRQAAPVPRSGYPRD